MAENFISVEAAKALIRSHVQKRSSSMAPLADACNLVLAAPVYAAIDLPSFNQSGVDGYAFCFADYEAGKPLTVVGESFAGNSEKATLQPGTAARIFTGAPVPQGADTVVMQEHCTRSGDALLIESPGIVCGLHVRVQGSEINKGALALESSSLLTPAAIGFLAGIGVSEVPVYGFPAITISATGKELVQPGQPLGYGQVYESNSLTLQNALQQLHIKNITTAWADDDLVQMTASMHTALEQSDLLLVTGGVSVGDYDYVVAALDACGVETIFHKVKQRPGKPLYFGKKGSKIVFGLPGNPSSVLSCFYNYVLPAIQQITGRSKPFYATRQLSLENTFTKNTQLTHFLKGYANGETVKHLAAQESFRLSSFAISNCLIEIPAASSSTAAGEMVTVHMIE